MLRFKIKSILNMKKKKLNKICKKITVVLLGVGAIFFLYIRALVTILRFEPNGQIGFAFSLFFWVMVILVTLVFIYEKITKKKIILKK